MVNGLALRMHTQNACTLLASFQSASLQRPHIHPFIFFVNKHLLGLFNNGYQKYYNVKYRKSKCQTTLHPLLVKLPVLSCPCQTPGLKGNLFLQSGE